MDVFDNGIPRSTEVGLRTAEKRLDASFYTFTYTNTLISKENGERVSDTFTCTHCCTNGQAYIRKSLHKYEDIGI